MKVLIAVFMDILNQIKRIKPTTRKGWLILVVIVILFGVGIKFFAFNGEEVVAETENKPTLIELAPAASYAGDNSVSLVGTVRAVSEAQIQAERGGRVTSVRVKAGDFISAGTIIATLENASEYASLLQAEGAYEAAQAAAASSNVGVNETTNNLNQSLKNAESTYQGAYTTVSDTVYNSLDTFYSSPTSGMIGLKIDGGSNTSYLNSEREAFRNLLSSWQSNSGTNFTNSNYYSLLSEAITYVERARNLVDILLTEVNNAETTEILNGLAVTSYSAGLNANRTTLNSLISSLTNAKTAVENTQEALARAEISGTGSTVSSANAQVKQALGALRAAQANYEKTILRTPIAGTVNSLKVNTGDYLAPSTQVAEVANNKALEISVFVGESDLELVKVGEKVTIGSGTEGTIVSVAPGIDSITQKTEVKIAAEDNTLTNGNTVIVNLKIDNKNIDSALLIPITSVKFTATEGSVFTVEDNKLKIVPITIGSIRGNLIEVTEGITTDTLIVKDARGLSEGQSVTTE